MQWLSELVDSAWLCARLVCLCDEMAGEDLKTFLGEVQWEGRDDTFDALVLKVFHDNGIKVQCLRCASVYIVVCLCIVCRHFHT